MKQRAILYTRVSTDEQNDGYSPSDQKARLIKYCEHNNIEIVGFYHDDETGKHFNRPQWLNIISYLKKHRGEVDLLLFIKWDRFSRNIAEAYIAIKELNKFQVEPQAIEQPLNLEIPEQKLMLAIYLAAPEVDNDRRALNIFHGIRRAKKEGRWLGMRLRGYKNARDERNRPIMVPAGDKQQKLIVTAFERFATGLYPMEELRRQLLKDGMKISRNSFWVLLRNKGYIGRVFVPAYKDEPAEWVDGNHEPIIDEQTFYTVQDILLGRKKNLPNRYAPANDALPLRGFLTCPQCGRKLTGSASKGRHGGKFFYYHCAKGCKERKNAKEANQLFLNILGAIKLNPASIDLFRATLKELLQGNNKQKNIDIGHLTKEIDKQEQRLKNARALMLDGEIKPEEYREMKIEIEETLSRLKAEGNQLKEAKEDYGQQIEFCIHLLSNLDRFYNSADLDTKRKIVGSIFPEKLVYDKNKYRTPRINEVVGLLSNEKNGGKSKRHAFYGVPSLEVVS